MASPTEADPSDKIEQQSHVALMASGVALLLGIAGNLLFRVGELGLNALLAAILLTVVFHLLTRHFQLPLKGAALWLTATVPVLAAVLVWRASLPLIALSVLAVLLALISTALIAHDHSIKNRTFLKRQGQEDPEAEFCARGTWDLIAEALATAFHAVFGIFRLGVATRGSMVNWAPWNTRTGAVLRGVLLATPPLIIFGALFAGADPAFAQLLNNLISVDLNLLGNHIFVTGVFTWLAAGWLYWTVVNDGKQLPCSDALGIRIAALEVSVALGLVMALFIAFIAVQFRYLFGGEEEIQATTGLTYAEYAREGFFQLVAVAFLVLPLLLVGLWLVRGESARNQRLVRLLAIGLEVLIILILASALYRMRLYQEAYGLTYLRFLTTAFIIWLAVVFALFSATVLRGAPRWFIHGALVSALIAVVLLAIVNPDARIVEANVQRAQAGLQFDDNYLRELSSDAVPAILASLAISPEPGLCATAHWLLLNWGSTADADNGSSDWHAWNYSASRARRLVQESEDRLQGLACKTLVIE